MSIFRILCTLILLLFLSSCSVSKSSEIVTSKKQAIEQGTYQTFSAKEISKINKANQAIKKEKLLAAQKEKAQQAKLKKAKKLAAKIKRDSIAAVVAEAHLSEKTEEIQIRTTLINKANDYLGTPYRYGGTTKKGIDCSGFICKVFNSIDFELPRTSVAQSMVGEKIKKEKAKTGDLIFFKTSSRNTISHVGMVLNNFDGEIFFIHASTSKGVMVSSLDETYYKTKYAKIKRVLN